MTQSPRETWWHATGQLLPSLAFFLCIYTSGNLRLAGWVSALFAAIICCAYARRVLRPHGLLLGINLYMCFLTPSIEGLFALGCDTIANALIVHAQSLVLTCILVTGLALTLFAPNGFLSNPAIAPHPAKRGSLVLLGLSGLAVLWNVSVDGTRLVQIGLPMSALFVAHRLLTKLALAQTAKTPP